MKENAAAVQLRGTDYRNRKLSLFQVTILHRVIIEKTRMRSSLTRY